MITYRKNGNWSLYWGAMPLPRGAEAIGIVTRDSDGSTGALIRLSNGRYVQGNAGSIRTLSQSEVEQALLVSDAAAALGRIKSEAKTEANRAKSSLPPKEGKRPRGRPATKGGESNGKEEK
jgi:hypothetical protein